VVTAAAAADAVAAAAAPASASSGRIAGNKSTSYRVRAGESRIETRRQRPPDPPLSYLDVVAVRQEHGQAVDADAPPGRWRKTVLQRLDEALVNGLRLIVASLLVLHQSTQHLSAYPPMRFSLFPHK
jgi:hypothetical protein